eukprot:33678_1
MSITSSPMNHHGPLPVRRLASIKTIDKCSCYVIGLSDEFAQDKLKSQLYFSRFGEVRSIRILQNKKPSEIYIRFEAALSATLAINWCNANLQNNCATHGYQKYCMRFLKEKQCFNSRCQNRHSWCAPDEIIAHKKQPSALEDHQGGSSAACKDQQMVILQRQFLVLQSQINQQNEFIQDLVSTITSLKSQNKCLKYENVQMQQRLHYDDYCSLSPSSMSLDDVYEIDDIVDCVIQSDEQHSTDSSGDSSNASRSLS